MKLLHIGDSHIRNVEFVIRACQKFNIEYLHTDNLSPPDLSYDFIWSPSTWIHPDLYPNSKIIFGPQFWVYPSLEHPLFTQTTSEHASRCIYLCLSDWIKTMYTEFIPTSKQIIPFVPFPFGLSIDAMPKDNIEYDCIIYFKHRHPSLLEFCKNIISLKGLTYKIYEYGSYNREEYLSTLRKVRFAVWIGSHESQGFALEECLATNTPIYLYDVHSIKDEYVDGNYSYQNYSQQLIATSAPYWNEQCGMKIYTNEEFELHLTEFITKLSSYHPMTYVQSTLTDEICFQRWLDILNTHHLIF